MFNFCAQKFYAILFTTCLSSVIAQIPVYSVAHAVSLENTARKYIQEKGVAFFLDEYCNLTSKRPFIVKNNYELAMAMNSIDSSIKESDLPVLATRKNYRLKKFQGIEKEIKNSIKHILISEFTVTSYQRLFLEWYFNARSSIGFSRIIIKPGRVAVMGWNNEILLHKGSEFQVSTPGVNGCSVILAVAKQGDLVFMHYQDTATVIKRLAYLHDKCKGLSKVYIVNSLPSDLANIIDKKFSSPEIYIHQQSPNDIYFIFAIGKEDGFSILNISSPYHDEYYEVYSKYDDFREYMMSSLNRFGPYYPPDNVFPAEIVFQPYKGKSE